MLGLEIVIALSVLAQLGAAVLAWRLIRVTGHRPAWTLVSLAIFGMAVRRIIPMARLLFGGEAPTHDMLFETVGLVVSLLMLVGISGIAPLFQSIRSHEEALRRSEEKFRRIIGTAQEGIWIIGAGETAEYVNRRMADMLGYAPEEMRGRKITDFLHQEACAEALRHMERIDSGTKEPHDCRFRRKDGLDLWALVCANPITDDAGRRIGTLAMVTDISDRKRMEWEREGLIRDLQDALTNVKSLRGLLPICSSCNKVRDESGYWHPMEVYIRIHSEARLSAGLCPDCAPREGASPS